MTESDQNIDKTKVEIVANAAAKIVVSSSPIFIFYCNNTRRNIHNIIFYTNFYLESRLYKSNTDKIRTFE